MSFSSVQIEPSDFQTDYQQIPADDSDIQIMASPAPQADVAAVETRNESSHSGASTADGPRISDSSRMEEEEVDPGAQVVSLLKPVTITMLLVIFLVRNLSPVSDNRSSFSDIMVYTEEEEDSAGQKLVGSLENALVFLGMVFGFTVLLLLLYKYRCMRIIYGWLILSTSMLLGMFGFYAFRLILEVFYIPLDIISAALLLWNFAVVGTLSIFWHAPNVIRQGYLVVVSALLAWTFTKLPEWTTWAILAAVSLYDLCAVLSPRGPLKVLVEESQRRNEPIPGLVYEGHSVKLGLGDFVFYSVLVGRAALSDYVTIVACMLSILTGLCLTLFLLGLFQKALPALPISIFLGILFFFTTKLMVTPMITALEGNLLYL